MLNPRWMSTPRWSAALASDRSRQMLPFLFGAALFAGIAMQTKLLPMRPSAMDIPSTLGIAPGAAPKESVAPAPAVGVAAPATPLPRESVPADSGPAGTAEASYGAPARAERSVPAIGAADSAWDDRLPSGVGGEGAGNMRGRSREPSVISSLLANLSQSLKRLHPLTAPRAKAIALPPIKKPIKSGFGTNPRPVNPSLAGWGLGGAAPRRNILGGPTPLAMHYAPSINGSTIGPRH